METIKWLTNWFVEHSSEQEATVRNSLNVNYMENGLIDSFGFVQMLSDIDDEYDILFQNEDFQDQRFFTIEGLATMIEERK